MVKLHRASEELPIDRGCCGCELRKKSKEKTIATLHYVKQLYLGKLSHRQNTNSPTYSFERR